MNREEEIALFVLAGAFRTASIIRGGMACMSAKDSFTRAKEQLAEVKAEGLKLFEPAKD